MDHYATAHSRPEYRCIKCNLTSSSLEHFSIHSAQCTEIPDIEICDFCPYIFDASKPFDKFDHIKSHLMNSDAVDNSATVLNASGINTYGWRFLRFLETFSNKVFCLLEAHWKTPTTLLDKKDRKIKSPGWKNRKSSFKRQMFQHGWNLKTDWFRWW